MKTCNKTIPTIVEGNSLYEAVCVIKDVAEKAIAEAGTTATAAEAAKAAAAQAQATANQAHEEAINAQTSAEQANENAQGAQLTASSAANQASKAKDAADAAQATANGAVTKNIQQDARIDDIESGKTTIPTYFKTTNQGNAIPGMNGAGTAAVYYWATGTTSGDLPLRRHNQSGTANGGLLVPRVPINSDEAASKSYVDSAVAGGQFGMNIAHIGAAVQADESAAAVEQISIESTTLSNFANNANTNLRIINIQGRVASDFSQNTSKKFTFSLENVFSDEKLPASIGLTFFDFSTATRAALCAFSTKSTGEPILTIDFTNIDPQGGHSFEIFGTAIFTFTA